MGKTVGAEVPEPAHRALSEIAWANKMDNSKVVRRALDHYLRTNPDGLVLPENDLDTWKASVVSYRE